MLLIILTNLQITCDCYIASILQKQNDAVVKHFRLYNYNTFILQHHKLRSRSDYRQGSGLSSLPSIIAGVMPTTPPEVCTSPVSQCSSVGRATCSVIANCFGAYEFNTCSVPANYNLNRIRI